MSPARVSTSSSGWKDMDRSQLRVGTKLPSLVKMSPVVVSYYTVQHAKLRKGMSSSAPIQI